MQPSSAYHPSAATHYETHYTFTAAKYDETTWQRLLPNSLEGYRYHLAFELGNVRGFKTGYISILKAGIVVLIAPIFITDYTPHQDAATQHVNPSSTSNTIRLLCVGSPATDSAQIGFFKDQPLDAEVIKVLNRKLHEVALREGANAIKFKDLMDEDAKHLQPLLESDGFLKLNAIELRKNIITFKNIQDYLAELSKDIDVALQNELSQFEELQIKEQVGSHALMEEIYRLYTNSFNKNEYQSIRLTIEFFESLVGLMPNQCRFVLYYLKEKLIGFNFLLHGNGILMDKYSGEDDSQSNKFDLSGLQRIYNLRMCMRDGFHTFLGNKLSYNNVLSLNADLKPTLSLIKYI